MIMHIRLFGFIVFLFLSYCSYSQVNKIVLSWESGREFRRDKLTITLHKTASTTASGSSYTYHHEECPLYVEKNEVCRFCEHFRGRDMKETRIVKQKTKIIKKTLFDSILNVIESLDVNELEKNNNLYYPGRFWRPPTMKLELYENDVNTTFSFEYASATDDHYVPNFPTALLPLNTIAQDIFKLAGIKSKRYCVRIENIPKE